MKSVKTVLAGISSAAIFVIAPAAIAQQSPGLLSVNIANVARHIAKNLNVDVGQVPMMVQIHLDLAAQVCNIPADVLVERHRSGIGTCTAEVTNTELDQTVLGQVRGATR